MNGDGQIAGEARTKIFAFKHARQAILRAQMNHVVPGKFFQPFAVVTDFGVGFVQDFAKPVPGRSALRVGFHLLARQALGCVSNCPVGSPTMAVKSPIRKIAVWPRS